MPAKEDLQCELVMGWLGEHPSGLALGSKLISDTYSSTNSRFSCPRSRPRASPVGELVPPGTDTSAMATSLRTATHSVHKDAAASTLH